MASDEIVWQVINQQFCSFKLKYATSFLRPSALHERPPLTQQQNRQEAELLPQ